jgi:hypothetical protein
VDLGGRTQAPPGDPGLELGQVAQEPLLVFVADGAIFLDAAVAATEDLGPSGVYLAGLLQRLGIAEQLRAKSELADADVVSLMIANGEAELGIVIIPNILNVPGAEVVGPLPKSMTPAAP